MASLQAPASRADGRSASGFGSGCGINPAELGGVWPACLAIPSAGIGFGSGCGIARAGIGGGITAPGRKGCGTDGDAAFSGLGAARIAAGGGGVGEGMAAGGAAPTTDLSGVATRGGNAAGGETLPIADVRGGRGVGTPGREGFETDGVPKRLGALRLGTFAGEACGAGPHRVSQPRPGAQNVTQFPLRVIWA